MQSLTRPEIQPRLTFIAAKTSTGFGRLPNSASLLRNINTDALEYAACISADELELYFTRLTLSPEGVPSTSIMQATRKTVDEPFGLPHRIPVITGFAEAPTISPDQKTIYYYKKEGDKFALYRVSKN